MDYGHPLYRDSDRLDRCIAALTEIKRDMAGSLELSLAEACLDDTDDMVSTLLARLAAARELTQAECERVEAAEMAA